MTKLLSARDPKVQESAWQTARYLQLPNIVARASKDVMNASLNVEERARAMHMLPSAPLATVLRAFDFVFSGVAPSGLQSAAVQALGTFDDASAVERLTGKWRSYAPEARVKALGVLLATRNGKEQLLGALEAGAIEPSALDGAARARLLEMGDRARKVLKSAGDDRQKVVDSYQQALALTGDMPRGKRLFEENCGRCHLPGKTGGRIGPDLSGINNKTKQELLQSILNPSYAIEPRFTNYLVTTKDGRMFDGLIANETANLITLRNGSEEGDQTILRSQIGEVRASTVSLMPDDLEKTISPQGMADILAYLRGGL